MDKITFLKNLKPAYKISAALIIFILLFVGVIILATSNKPVVEQNHAQTIASTVEFTETATPDISLSPTDTPIITASPISIKDLQVSNNWLTYTNSKYNYTFKYPSDLAVSDSGKVSSFETVYIAQKDIAHFISSSQGEFNLNNNVILKISLLQNKIDEFKSNDYIAVSNRQIQINDHLAMEYTFTAIQPIGNVKTGDITKTILYTNKDKIYKIDLLDSNNFDLAQNMLNTLRFN
jgi:hypothetical protein